MSRLLDRAIVIALRAGQSHGGTLRPFIRAAIVPVLLVVVLALAFAGAVLAGAKPHCSSACIQRVEARHREYRYQVAWSAAPAATRAHLRRIAQCESGGNERAVSPGGTYRGLLQFDALTWSTMGGKGDPAAASRWEQWARGARLYGLRGAQPWPVCRFR